MKEYSSFNGFYNFQNPLHIHITFSLVVLRVCRAHARQVFSTAELHPQPPVLFLKLLGCLSHSGE